MKITRRTILKFGAAASLPLLAACNSKSTPTSDNKVHTSASGETAELTIGLTYIPNIQFAAFYVAKEEGIFTDQGLNITLRHHGAQENLFGALLSNTEQIVCASSDEGVAAYKKDTPIITTATLYQRYPACVIVLADSGYKTLKDLTGKKIGLPGKYGSGYYATLAGLKEAGMTLKDIDLQNIGYTQLTALKSKRMDAVIGFLNNEPIAAAKQGMDVKVIELLNPNKPTLAGPGLLTVQNKINKSVLDKVNKAILVAEKRIAADLSVGIKAAKKYVPSINTEQARESAKAVLAATVKLWKDTNGNITTDINPKVFKATCELLAETKIWKNPVDYKETFLS